MKIVAVGECTRDRYRNLGIETVGGISLNFAIHARRSGASAVALVSCTGSDDASLAIRGKLAHEGIDTVRLRTMPGATASQVILVSDHGERIFPPGGYDPGVLDSYQLDATDLAFIGACDIVAAPRFRQVEHLFQPAMQAAAPGAKRVVDLLDGEELGPDLSGIDGLLDVVDLVFVSGNEAAVEVLLPRSRDTRTLIVVTHGAGGSTAMAGGYRYFEPAVPVPIEERIDTTGCGDAFQAAFTVEYFRRGVLSSAMQAGAARAAEVIRHHGATGP